MPETRHQVQSESGSTPKAGIQAHDPNPKKIAKEGKVLTNMFPWLKTRGCEVTLHLTTYRFQVAEIIGTWDAGQHTYFLFNYRLRGQTWVPRISSDFETFCLYGGLSQQVHCETICLYYGLSQQAHCETICLYDSLSQQAHCETICLYDRLPQQVHCETICLYDSLSQQVHRKTICLYDGLPQQVHWILGTKRGDM